MTLSQQLTGAWSHIKSEFDHFKYIKGKAEDYAQKKLWWDNLCRQICPDVFNILHDKLEIDDFIVECIIVGKNQGIVEGIPAETAYSFQRKLMDTTLKGCIIQVTEKFVSIPTENAQSMVEEAIYYNQGNQKDYMDANDLGVQNQNLVLDHRDLIKQVEILHDNKENLFHAAFVITIWAEDEAAMKIAKSRIKGVLRENRILGELPLRKMYEAFMTGQPYPEMWEGSVIEMYTGMLAILSPTINPLSPLAGTGTGVYFGHEVDTGKDIAIDFWSESAPHSLIVGATGSGKTFALILLMIRLYLEGRKVMYLTKKRDKDTNYRAIAEYFGQNGAILEIGRGKLRVNPLQIICASEEISEDEAIDIYDTQKELICAFIKSYFRDGYSPNMDSFIDRTLTELYSSAEFGILRNAPLTWKTNKWPVMGDLIDKWERDLPSLKGHRKNTCSAIIDKMHKFTWEGAYDFINGQTNADFSKRFTVVDIVRVPKGLKEPMNILLTGILSSQVSAVHSKGLTVVIDEGGSFLRDEDLQDMLFEGLTQWRSQNTQLIFALHQLDDLKNANLDAAFMTNTFFKFIFGANMDESVVPHVQKFFHLKDQQLEDLMSLKQGECLIKHRNKYIKCAVTASQDEYNIIKGIKPAEATGEENTTKEEVKIINKIKELYKDLSEQNNTILESFIDGKFSAKDLQNQRYKKFSPSRALDSGSINLWVHDSRIKGKLIENQTPDHWGTVIQIAAYLYEMGFYNIFVNHRNKVDVEAMYKGKSYAFEFERDGTHSVQQIKEKFLSAKAIFDKVLIVSMSTNAKKCLEAVEHEENTVPRGTQLKDWIDEVVKEADKTTEKPVADVVSNPVSETIKTGKTEDTNSQEEVLNPDFPHFNLKDEMNEAKEISTSVDLFKEAFLINEDEVVGQAIYDEFPEGTRVFLSANLNKLQLKTFKRSIAKKFLKSNPEEAKVMYEQACRLLGGDPETDLKTKTEVVLSGSEGNGGL